MNKNLEFAIQRLTEVIKAYNGLLKYRQAEIENYINKVRDNFKNLNSKVNYEELDIYKQAKNDTTKNCIKLMSILSNMSRSDDESEIKSYVKSFSEVKQNLNKSFKSLKDLPIDPISKKDLLQGKHSINILNYCINKLEQASAKSSVNKLFKSDEPFMKYTFEAFVIDKVTPAAVESIGENFTGADSWIYHSVNLAYMWGFDSKLLPKSREDINSEYKKLKLEPKENDTEQENLVGEVKQVVSNIAVFLKINWDSWYSDLGLYNAYARTPYCKKLVADMIFNYSNDGKDINFDELDKLLKNHSKDLEYYSQHPDSSLDKYTNVLGLLPGNLGALGDMLDNFIPEEGDEAA